MNNIKNINNSGLDIEDEIKRGILNVIDSLCIADNFRKKFIQLTKSDKYNKKESNLINLHNVYSQKMTLMTYNLEFKNWIIYMRNKYSIPDTGFTDLDELEAEWPKCLDSLSFDDPKEAERLESSDDKLFRGRMNIIHEFFIKDFVYFFEYISIEPRWEVVVMWYMFFNEINVDDGFLTSGLIIDEVNNPFIKSNEKYINQDTTAENISDNFLLIKTLKSVRNNNSGSVASKTLLRSSSEFEINKDIYDLKNSGKGTSKIIEEINKKYPKKYLIAKDVNSRISSFQEDIDNVTLN